MQFSPKISEEFFLFVSSQSSSPRRVSYKNFPQYASPKVLQKNLQSVYTSKLTSPNALKFGPKVNLAEVVEKCFRSRPRRASCIFFLTLIPYTIYASNFQIMCGPTSHAHTMYILFSLLWVGEPTLAEGIFNLIAVFSECSLAEGLFNLIAIFSKCSLAEGMNNAFNISSRRT